MNTYFKTPEVFEHAIKKAQLHNAVTEKMVVTCNCGESNGCLVTKNGTTTKFILCESCYTLAQYIEQSEFEMRYSISIEHPEWTHSHMTSSELEEANAEMNRIAECGTFFTDDLPETERVKCSVRLYDNITETDLSTLPIK